MSCYLRPRIPGAAVFFTVAMADHLAHARYCWINPVKHGFVGRRSDWPQSSIHREIRLGRVAPEWSGEALEGAFGEQG